MVNYPKGRKPKYPDKVEALEKLSPITREKLEALRGEHRGHVRDLEMLAMFDTWAAEIAINVTADCVYWERFWTERKLQG